MPRHCCINNMTTRRTMLIITTTIFSHFFPQILALILFYLSNVRIFATFCGSHHPYDVRNHFARFDVSSKSSDEYSHKAHVSINAWERKQRESTKFCFNFRFSESDYDYGIAMPWMTPCIPFRDKPKMNEEKNEFSTFLLHVCCDSCYLFYWLKP